MVKKHIVIVTALILLPSCSHTGSYLEKKQNIFRPNPSSNLNLTAPINRWDEAIPLGNGLTGGLLWGEGGNIRLSLDRADLWDLRTHETIASEDWNIETLKKLVAERNQAKIVELFDVPYSAPYPSKLPAGRLEVTLDESQQAKSFHLDLLKAVGSVRLETGSMEVFFSAAESVTMVRITGSEPGWSIIPPSVLSTRLNYDPPQTGTDGTCRWFLQKCALDMQYAIVAQIKRVRNTTEIALSITSTHDTHDPLGLGRKRVASAIEAGYDKMLKPHLKWWQDFWAKSEVVVPDKKVQQHYDLVQYFYGAASRKGAPPIHLQGVWTADNGELPPWKGDYHNDLNTEMTYWAYLTSGRFDEGESFLDFMGYIRDSQRANQL